MMAVTVDDDFARFGGKSYAINKINSVEVRERQPHGLGGAIICGSIAALCVLAAFAGGDLLGLLVIAVVLAAIAYAQWKQSTIREYQLFLVTSASETQAFVSRNELEVSRLRQQIETAMLRHSRAGTDR